VIYSMCRLAGQYDHLPGKKKALTRTSSRSDDDREWGAQTETPLDRRAAKTTCELAPERVPQVWSPGCPVIGDDERDQTPARLVAGIGWNRVSEGLSPQGEGPHCFWASQGEEQHGQNHHQQPGVAHRDLGRVSICPWNRRGATMNTPMHV